VKPFTPAKIKADLVFVAALAAVFHFNLPDSVSIALIGAAALIATGLNIGEALLERFDPGLIAEATRVAHRAEADKLLPVIANALAGLPGSIGVEVKRALELAGTPVVRVTGEGCESKASAMTIAPAKPGGPVHMVVRDLSTDKRFTSGRFHNAIAAVEQQLLTHFNDSPWVEEGIVAAFGSFSVIEATDPIPAGAWVVEFLDDDPNAPGALGYHEDQVFNNEARAGRPSKASRRSMRGLARHPETGALIPLLKILVKTTYDDGEWPSEVFSHEALEALVDPFVTGESTLRRYLNAKVGKWYIGEVCDAVQGRGYYIKGVLVSDFVYPRWFAQPQTRSFTTCASEHGTAPEVAPWEVTSAGYMSVAPQNEPTNWTQIGPGAA
jgi:hypothetical protein